MGDKHYDNLFTIKADDHHMVALSSNSNEIAVWSTESSKPRVVRTLKNIPQPKDIKMVDSHRALVLCNRELRLYDLNRGALVTKLKGVMNQNMPFYGIHGERYCVALSRNRMYVNFMNLDTGDLETTFKVGEDRFLNSLLVSSNGKVCVCGDETQKPFPLLVWDLINRKLIYDLRLPHHDFITRLSAISADGHYVVSVSKELNSTAPNLIVVYDLQSGMLFKKWKPDTNTTAISISSQSGIVVSGTDKCELIVWDLATGDKRHTLQGHSAPIDRLQISENGKRLLSVDSTRTDAEIKVWDLDSGTCLNSFAPSGELSCYRLSANGNVLVYGLKSSPELLSVVLNESELDSSSPAYGDAEHDGAEFELSKD